MLRQALKDGSFVITCEFVPGRGAEGPAVDAAAQFAKDIAAANVKVHAISITDNPGGGPAISPDVLGVEIQKAGGEALVHFSCRDRNRNAMESRAMALARSGIRNLLVITGDYPSPGGYEGAGTPVFDLDSVQAIRYLKSMNAGLEVPGRKPGTVANLPPTDFLIGAAVSPFKLTEEELILQYFKMERKAAAGADFFIPQLGYDMRKFFEIKRYLASRKINVPVIGNVYALTAGAAQAMKEGGVPGCVVTDELVNLLKAEAAEPDKGKGKRLERAAKMVAMFKGMGFNGVHIGGFGLKSQDFVYIIQRGLELAPQWDSFIGEVSFSRPDEFYAFPPPAKYQVSESEADPATRIGLGRPVLAYSFMSAVHSLMFERGSLGCKAMTAYYGVVDKQPLLSRMSHAFEHASKQLIFGCRDCGDCGLPDLAYRCPTSRCAKQQRNGPCGGSRDGMCEVYPTEKECAWSEVYRRLKGCGRIEELRTAYVPPCHRELSYTSGWANFYLNRDHTAIRPKASPEAAATPGKPGTAAPAAAIH